MFTGIVEQLGVFQGFSGPEMRVTWPGLESLGEEIPIGASVSNNGVCLTVIGIDKETLCYEVVDETLSRSNLGRLKPGDPVNLERAARVSDRLDGHIVQGHVDQVGEIVTAAPDLRIRLSGSNMSYLVEKGSVTVDGISLTVVELFKDGFSIAVIPHTSKVTTLGYKVRGDLVNLEFDVLAKYVERMLAFR